MVTTTAVKTTTYTHLELGQEVPSGIAGYYTPQKEVRLDCQGRQVLCIIGRAVVESSCCGTGSWTYAVVPGYVVNWKSRQNEAGLPVSEVEPVSDEETREQVRKALEATEAATLIGFW